MASKQLIGLVMLTAWASSAAGAVAASSTSLKPIDPAALQNTVDIAAKEFMIPGVLVLLRTPQGEIVVSSGTTQLAVTNPPRADTHFRIASNTKTMTAAVIMQLAQEGRLDLAQPVSQYIPGVPGGDDITIAELMKMRSGLYEYTDAPELAASLDGQPTKAWTSDELLAIAFRHTSPFPLGKNFHYCNTNYALLGLIIEKVEGKPLATVFQARLFQPLGLTDTALPASDANTLEAPYAHGYLYGGSSYALVDQPYPADLQAAARAGTLQPVDATEQNPSYASAAGGVVSTAADLATWIGALVGGEVLAADYQRQWLESPEPEHPDAPDGQKYGYGIAKISFGPNQLYFHGGEMPGYNSFIGHDPINRMTLIVWANLTVALDGRPTANAIMLRLLDEIYVEPPAK